MNKNSYDILFLGRMFPLGADGEIRKKQRVDMQDAANVLQWNLIKGLLHNNGSRIQAVSYLPIDSWPKHYKDPFVRKECRSYEEGIDFQYVGFCNIMYIKQLLNRHTCDRAVAKWAKEDHGKQKILICYSCKNILMRAAKKAKAVNPSVKVIQVIADITEFAANSNPNGLQKAFIQAQMRENARLEKHIDSYVLLTKQMKERLGLNKPYIVMEGIVPERNLPVLPHQDQEKKTVLYTGSMNGKYGILELLEAFCLIPHENYRLILCGLGNAEPIIAEYANRDSRIQFLGKVSHDEALRLQSQATVLVNPRQNNEEFTKYSFPSKTMEYLASGVPLVAYKLDGIPDEYDGYIHYVPDNSPAALAQAIIAVGEKTQAERADWGSRGQKYVLENKNAYAQTKRILELIDSLF